MHKIEYSRFSKMIMEDIQEEEEKEAGQGFIGLMMGRGWRSAAEDRSV